MRRVRLTIATLLALGLAPGTCVRSELPPPRYDAGVAIQALDVPRAQVGELELVGAWQLSSPNEHFGGYSDLVALDESTFLAASDRGRLLRFSRPDTGSLDVAMGWFDRSGPEDKHLVDIESLVRDPGSGALWAGFEGHNAIQRQDASGNTRVEPPGMDGWGFNSGPEAMARLSDGRFVVLSEGADSWGGDLHMGLLFPGDPVASPRALRFPFRPPEGYRPTAMTALPDGRVLIVVRRVDWGFPPGFDTQVLLADSAEISPDRPWEGRLLAQIDDPAPRENYEGIATTPLAGGGYTIWLICDDNISALQRTLLLAFDWDGER